MVIKACSPSATIAQLILFTGLLISLPNSGIQLSQARPEHLCEELRHGSIGKFKNRKDLVALDGTRNSRCFHEGMVSTPRESKQDNSSGIDQFRTTTGFRVKMKHRNSHPLQKSTSFKNHISQSLKRDITRIHVFKDRIRYAFMKPSPKNFTLAEQKYRIHHHTLVSEDLHGQSKKLEGTVESGASLGSGEYFIDIFIGTPPRHILVIIDTGSDLTWVQCTPCLHCYLQKGPVFNPYSSKSYDPVACGEPKCAFVESSNNRSTCATDSQGCSYFYWYGDSSNTTGDFATETFTLNKTIKNDEGEGEDETLQIPKIMFGCGHNNEGLFAGAGGVLGLGQGEISFTSQVGSIYGNRFSYCLVGRDNPLTVSSTITFGADDILATLHDVQFTPFVKNPLIDTFYYVNISHLTVGKVKLAIPNSTWRISPHDGAGGTIIDSGTTLTYFPCPTHQIIQSAFDAQISLPKASSLVMPSPNNHLCYNITGVNLSPDSLPAFDITFENGAVWRIPSENIFILPDPDVKILCLGIVGSPPSSMSIIGNYLQQNFHMVFDRANSQLGFAARQCDSL